MRGRMHSSIENRRRKNTLPLTRFARCAGAVARMSRFARWTARKSPHYLVLQPSGLKKAPDNRSILAILAIAGLFQSPNHTIVSKAAKRALGLSSKVPPHKPAITHLTFVQLVGGQQTHDLEPSLLVAAHRPQVVHTRVHDNDDESDE